MPLWQCDWAGCGRPGVQRAGDCPLCNKHLCRIHLQDHWHKCPEPEDDWDAYSRQYVATEARQMAGLRARIDGAKLCARASHLRGGIPCTTDLSAKNLSAMMGGQNCHAEITFDDGVVWLARFRLAKVSSPPLAARDYILRSEVATMMFLHTRTRVPVPKVFDWAAESDPENDVGLGYSLMEKLPGRPLEWQTLTGQQKEKVMQQLAGLFLEMEKHPFETFGSLMPSRSEDSGFEVQGIAHHSTFNMTEQSGQPLGPFASSAEAARALVEYYLDMIASGEVGSQYLDDVFLAHRFRLDVIDGIWEVQRQEKVYLKHPDDKGNHILVDEAFNIVGVIDWEWTRTVSKKEAFSSPCMMWPVGRFYEGFNELSADEVRFADMFRERGRHDLAACVMQGRNVQRFYFALGPSSEAHGSRETFMDLFAGLRGAVGFEEEAWSGWRAQALQQRRSD